MARRGAYAKGIAKRQEILDTALEVIARSGYRGASVKEIAEAVELSPAGLLYHFDTKEQLYVEVLRKRDEIDTARALEAFAEGGIGAALGAFVDTMRRNAETPGLVLLYSALAVEAADPDHPAHTYFLERRDLFRAALAGGIRQIQADGDLDVGLDPDRLAVALHALADGLQVHSLIEADLDMALVITDVISALAPASNPRGAERGDQVRIEG